MTENGPHNRKKRQGWSLNPIKLMRNIDNNFMNYYPHNLKLMHSGEEKLYQKSVELISVDERWLLHVGIVEQAMDMADIFRQHPTEDEDIKVIQMLGMRVFNAFASSLKLMLSGYYQNSALILRDILETVFLLDFFRTDRPAIAEWRFADKKTRMKMFKPVEIRDALDKRDGFNKKKRAHLYSVFSELAAHPNMKSVAMLKPYGMDARIGPYVDPTVLGPVLSEMGRLSIQAGEVLDHFIPSDWPKGEQTQKVFRENKIKWMKEFYGSVT